MSGASPFAGRAVELERLTLALDDLGRKVGSLCLLVGEPGIGKTRLAEELSRRARERGALVVWGAAWDGGGAPAYFPWTQVLRALRGVLPEPSAGLRRDLGPLWEEEPARESVEDGDPEILHFRRCDALRAALASAAARTRPLVIVLDDLHAADQATLLALHFVARSLRSLPILIVCTHRDSDARLRPEIGALLARVARGGLTLALGRLDRDSVRSLMQELDPLAPKLVERVYESSGGNPFFVEEMLRLVRSGAPPDDIPDGVRALVTERLERLEPESLSVLRMAAVLGRTATLGTLASVAELPRHDLDERLRLPRIAGIVESAEADGISFSHPIFRECLYDSLSAGERGRMHQRAGEVLAASGRSGVAGQESVARHLLLALPAGNLHTAIERARAASRACRRALAFDRSVELLERAVVALGVAPDSQALLIDLEVELAEALVFVGQGQRSRSICFEAAEQARALADPARFARAALAYGAEIRVGVADPTQVALLEEALRVLGEDRDPALRARVMARLASTRTSPDGTEPIALAHAAIALARSTGDGECLLQALHMGGAALVCYAPPAERREVARELASLAQGQDELVLAQRGYQRWAFDAAELGDREELDEALRAEHGLGSMLGHARFRWKGALLRSLLALVDGRWADSTAAIEEAERLVAECEDQSARQTLAIHRVSAFRARFSGSASEVEAWFDDPVLASANASAIMIPLLGASALARLGDLERAREVFAKICPVPPPLLSFPLGAMIYADTAARLGDAATAAGLLPILEALPYPALTTGATAFAWEGFTEDVIGGIEVLLGRLEEGIASLENAIESAERFGARPRAVESRIALARALTGRAAAGDQSRARALLESAELVATEFDMQGSLTRIRAARGALPVLGAAKAPPVSTQSTAFSVTREGEVWSVASAAGTVRLKHSRALELLKQLTDHPGREFHVLELGADPEGGGAIDAGDAGELFDHEAKAAYTRRLADLREQIEEAERWNDSNRRARLQAELEFIEDELGRGLGAGGRLRRTPAAAERARVNVHKRLRGVIERLSTHLPELGRHLKICVKTGTFVSYQPSLDPSHSP